MLALRGKGNREIHVGEILLALVDLTVGVWPRVILTLGLLFFLIRFSHIFGISLM